jgi:hypothetical protein
MTRQKGEGIDRVLAASTSYPILSYPILSYAAVPPGLTVYRCRSCAMGTGGPAFEGEERRTIVSNIAGSGRKLVEGVLVEE